MRTRRQKRLLGGIALLVLGVFFCTLIEASSRHFFHDVLPEDEASFLHRLTLPVGKQALQTPVFTPWEDCAFSRLLSFLRASSFLTPVILQPEAGVCPELPVPVVDIPESWSGYTPRARDPPAFSLAWVSSGASGGFAS